MNLINCEHDQVQIPHTAGNGSDTLELFLSHLSDEDIRINEEHNRDVQQQDVYDEVDILDLENMDNSEIASYQWLNDNPGWWKE